MAYVNPFSRVSGLTAERIDQGVDFSGNGPVLAIGNAQVTEAESSGSGWPGLGGWVSYRLMDGPAAGRQVYVAEDFRPSVSTGQTISAGQEIGVMSSGSAGIETGWASGSGTSSLAQQYGGYTEGDHTALGDNFDALLVSLGVPKSPGLGSPNRGSVPSGFPTWGGNIPGTSGTPLPGASNAGLSSTILDKLLSLFGVPDIKDLAERGGLIIFGAAFIVAGILIATKKTGTATEKIKETVNGTERSESATSNHASDTGQPDSRSHDDRLLSGNDVGLDSGGG